METSPAFARQPLDAGALGYVRKDHADRDLPNAVHAAVIGERYVTPEVAIEFGLELEPELDGMQTEVR